MKWDVPPEPKLYPVGSKIGNSLMGFRAVGDGTAPPSTLRVNGTVTYQWTSNDTKVHILQVFLRLLREHGEYTYRVVRAWI